MKIKQKIKQMALAILLLHSVCVVVYAQQFSMDAVSSYPFPSELTSAVSGSKVAVAVNEKGKRNIYTAQGPQFALKKITAYDEDEGQEITGITFSPDGNSLLYVRGGDHGAFVGNVPRNPSAKTVAPRVLIFHIPFEGGAPVLIDEGDHPTFHPKNNTVAYLKNDQVGKPHYRVPETCPIFFARGRTNSINGRLMEA